MIQRLIELSIRQKFIVGLLVLGIIAWGVYGFYQVPLDAVPDITNNQVQVVTVSPTLSTQEVEKYITQPVERNMANIQGVKHVRSISRFGLSVITIVFEDNMPTLQCRQLVSEKLQGISSEIPPSIGLPELMPITTGLGEIYQYVLEVDSGYESKYDLMTLRTIQDWTVKKQLVGLKGIVEISSFGGYVKQYEVSVQPDRMSSLGVTLQELMDALAANNANTGASYIEKGEGAIFVRSEGMIQRLEDLGNIYVKQAGSVPVFVKDVASDIKFGHSKRFGAMTMDGKGEVVGGIILMLKGADSYAVVEGLKKRMKTIQESLPKGIHILPFIDRSSLIDKTIHTVSKNLIEGGLIVVFVLVLLLGNFRAGLIVASVIPLSMLFAFGMMSVSGVSANLMSLGALDFGLVVDGAVVIVEGVIHQMHIRYAGQRLSRDVMDQTVSRYSGRMMQTAIFGQVIILIVYIPILALVGIEGKMFKPMAMTVSFAIIGAIILSLTYVPMATSLFLNKNVRVKQTFSDRFMHVLEKAFMPVLAWVIRFKYLMVSISLGVFIISLWLFTLLGSVFIPNLEEGDLAMQMTMTPGTSLNQVIYTSEQVETLLLENFPEIKHVISKIGTAEVPTDPMGMEDTDIMIVLKKKSEWVSASTREELADKIKKKLEDIPGVSFEISQPIQLRFNELMSGSKADIAVKIFGDDLDVLHDYAIKASSLIAEVPGAADVKVEQVEGLSQLIVSPNRLKLAHYGIHIDELNTALRAAFAGEPVSVVYEEERKFDVVVRYESESREDLQVFDRMYLRTDKGGMVPVSAVADIRYVNGPVLISHENAQRRIVVGINVRNRDIKSLVDEIESLLSEKLPLPEGYYIRYGGEFENLQNASKRLMIAVPIALFLIFLFLFFAFGSFRYALMIYTAVPLAAIGGILALLLRGMPFSISAGVGFIALFGVAVLNGIVLIGYFNQLEKLGVHNIYRRILIGTKTRLRPVLMTAAVASLGFLPMALSQSAGGEVQRPLATVVIGGLITSTFLTLFLLPIIYLLFSRVKIKASQMIILLGLFTTGLVFPQTSNDTVSFTRDKCIQIALENHLEMKNAIMDEKIAKAEVLSAWDIPATDFRLERGQINYEQIDNHFSFLQSFGNIAQQIAQTSYNKQRLHLMKIYTRKKEAEITWQVSALYDEMTAALQKRKLLNREKQMLDELKRITQLAYDAGVSEYVDLLSITMSSQLLERRLMDLEASYAELASQLKTYLNIQTACKPLNDTLAPMRLPDDNVFPDSTQTLMIKPYYQTLLLSKKQLQTQRSAFWPGISAGYFNQQLEHVNGFQGFFVGLSIPILSFKNYTAVRVASLNKMKAENELSFQTQKLRNDIYALYQKIKKSEERISSYTSRSLPEAENLVKQAQVQYKTGVIDFQNFYFFFNQAMQVQYAYIDECLLHNQLVLAYSYLTAK